MPQTLSLAEVPTFPASVPPLVGFATSSGTGCAAEERSRCPGLQSCPVRQSEVQPDRLAITSGRAASHLRGHRSESISWEGNGTKERRN